MANLFTSYVSAYGKHPDIDTWCAESVYKEYPISGEEILAESTCHTSQLPWEDPKVFEKIALVINDRIVIGDIIQELSVPEIAFAVKELKRAFPDEHFNDAVSSYIAAACIAEGYTIVPKLLGFVQPKIPLTKLTDIQTEVLNAKLRAIDEVLE